MTVIKNVNKSCRSFLGGDQDRCCKIEFLASWNQLYRSNRLGGLGIMDLRLQHQTPLYACNFKHRFSNGGLPSSSIRKDPNTKNTKIVLLHFHPNNRISLSKARHFTSLEKHPQSLKAYATYIDTNTRKMGQNFPSGTKLGMVTLLSILSCPLFIGSQSTKTVA